MALWTARCTVSRKTKLSGRQTPGKQSCLLAPAQPPFPDGSPTCVKWVSTPATRSFRKEQVGKWIWKHSTGPEASGHELELRGQSRDEPRATEPQSWWTEAPGRETTRKEDRKGFQAGNQALCWPAAPSSAVPPHPPELYAHLGSAPVGPQAWGSHRRSCIPRAGPEDSTTEQCHLVPVAVDLLCAMCFTFIIT